MNELIKKPAEALSDIEQIERFAGYINAGVNSWINAGKLLVEMKAANSGVFKTITARFPAISLDLLESFERIGRKQVYPYLLLDNSPGCRRLLEMPYEKQVFHFGKKIRVVVALKAGEPVVVEKRIQELSKQEIQRLFDNDEIRNVERQVKIMEMMGGGTRSIDVDATVTRNPARKNGTVYYRQAMSDARIALKIADNVMFSWFSGEYADSKERKVVLKAIEVLDKTLKDKTLK